jgi:cellulose synthase/poly-beta-1,6-N-acetylglucosamine synthase-like glycosyltransferase
MPDHTLLISCLVGLAMAGAALAVYWGAVLVHVIRTFVRVPTARDGLRVADAPLVPRTDAPRSASAPMRVCVIVPAHNEAGTIERVTRSILAQDLPGDQLSAVFVLDRCTDDTQAILERTLAGDERAEVLLIHECPDDWAGKVHALHTAATTSPRARDADLLLFIDADTAMHPSCVRACSALLESRGLSMLSLLSTMSHARWFELAVQPAAGMELIRQYPLERANDREKPRAFANGQFMLFRRSAYDQIGGHAGVRSALLEDVELARNLARAGMPAGMFLADGLHMCSMYDSFAQFRVGWERIYIEAANSRPARLRAYATRIRVLGVWLPLASAAAIELGLITHARGQRLGMFKPAGSFDPVALAANSAIVLGGAGLAAMLVALVASFALSRTPIWASVLYPLGAWHTGGILRASARRLESGGQTRWGGRSYQLKPR